MTRPSAALLAAAIVVVAVLAGCGEPSGAPNADVVPYDGRSPQAPATPQERVLVELQRPSLGELVVRRRRPMRRSEQIDYVRSLQREAFSLRGALRARGIPVRDIVAFTRTWNGFAATVRARDLVRLQSLGVRPLPARRFYPAGTVGPQSALPRAAKLAGRAPIALLDSGVDVEHPLLRGRARGLYDTVDGDSKPQPGRDPRRPTRRELHGTALAGALAAAGDRVLAIRVSGLQPLPESGAIEEHARTDQLIAGLERAVDPNGDGDTSDRARVALVGVNAPYAGFAGSPEARAAAGAAALGTLVVAPAGNEGGAAGPYGTVGSPAAAPAALAVGALGGGRVPLLELRVAAGGAPWRARAALLGGPTPRAPLATGRLVDGEVKPGEVVETARAVASRKLVGRLAVVPRGAIPSAQAAAAAAAGAAAVVIADPAPHAPLPAVSGGRVTIPVLGIAGDAAERLLRDTGQTALVAFARAGSAASSGAGVSPFSARGPTFAGDLKPDLVARATVAGAHAAGGGTTVAGTAAAATRAALAASRLAALAPALGAEEIAARLTAVAVAGLDVRGAGAGALAPAGPGIRSDPRALRAPARVAGRPWAVSRTIVLTNDAPRPATFVLRAQIGGGGRAVIQPARVALPAGATRRVTVRLSGPARRNGIVTGRILSARRGSAALSVPVLVPIGRPAAPRLGALRISRRRALGVRFALGRFARGRPGITGARVEPVARLVLELVDGRGRAVRELTPPGGARELLPGVYAYTLRAATLRGLDPGRYRFRARAWAPRNATPVDRLSAVIRR